VLGGAVRRLQRAAADDPRRAELPQTAAEPGEGADVAPLAAKKQGKHVESAALLSCFE
jgi:hypothetical protein